jgi:hypothetical protein
MEVADSLEGLSMGRGRPVSTRAPSAWHPHLSSLASFVGLATCTFLWPVVNWAFRKIRKGGGLKQLVANNHRIQPALKPVYPSCHEFLLGGCTQTTEMRGPRRHGSSSRVTALKVQSPEFKPQSHKKEKKLEAPKELASPLGFFAC